MTSPTLDPRSERLARRRTALQFGWLAHAAAFASVNALLFVISWRNGHDWARWPLGSADALCRDRVARRSGWMQGARAQQG